MPARGPLRLPNATHACTTLDRDRADTARGQSGHGSGTERTRLTDSADTGQGYSGHGSGTERTQVNSLLGHLSSGDESSPGQGAVIAFLGQTADMIEMFDFLSISCSIAVTFYGYM